MAPGAVTVTGTLAPFSAISGMSRVMSPSRRRRAAGEGGDGGVRRGTGGGAGDERGGRGGGAEGQGAASGEVHVGPPSVGRERAPGKWIEGAREAPVVGAM